MFLTDLRHIKPSFLGTYPKNMDSLQLDDPQDFLIAFAYFKLHHNWQNQTLLLQLPQALKCLSQHPQLNAYQALVLDIPGSFQQTTLAMMDKSFYVEIVFLALALKSQKIMASLQKNHRFAHGFEAEFLITDDSEYSLQKMTHAIRFLSSIKLQAPFNLDYIHADPLGMNYSLWMAALRQMHRETAHYLLDMPAIRQVAASHDNQALFLASQFNHPELITRLLQLFVCNDTAAVRRNRALNIAIVQGHTQCVINLLESQTIVKCEVALSLDNLIAAIQSDKTAIVLTLLKHPLIFSQVHLHDNRALLCAIHRNSPLIVQRLVQSLKVRATKRNHPNLLGIAIMHNYTEVFESLISLPEFQERLSQNHNLLLRLACRFGRKVIVGLLLKFPEVVKLAAVYNNEALRFAIDYKYHDIIDQLMHLDTVRTQLPYFKPGLKVKVLHWVEGLMEWARNKLNIIVGFFKQTLSFLNLIPPTDYTVRNKVISQQLQAELWAHLQNQPGFDKISSKAGLKKFASSHLPASPLGKITSYQQSELVEGLIKQVLLLEASYSFVKVLPIDVSIKVMSYAPLQRSLVHFRKAEFSQALELALHLCSKTSTQKLSSRAPHEKKNP